MFLIAGLGNPGTNYTDTRHNAGFMLLDYLAKENNLVFADSKWKGLAVKASLWGQSVVLLKPQTYMNNSGVAVAAAAHFYKLPLSNIIVIHDDLDLPFGRTKITSGGGDAGHKGIRSCIEHLGAREFIRIKMGIGRPSSPIPPEKYVLAKFSHEEMEEIAGRMAEICDGLKILLRQGATEAMNIVNRRG